MIEVNALGMRATLIIYFPKTSPRGISELKRGLRISPESPLFPRWCRRGDSTAWALASQAIGLGGAASGWRAPVRRAYPPVRRRPKPVRVPMEHQMKRKKEPTDFSGLLRVSSGAEGGTRTPTGFPTTPPQEAVVCTGFAVRTAFPSGIRKDVLRPQVRGPLHHTYRDNRHCNPE